MHTNKNLAQELERTTGTQAKLKRRGILATVLGALVKKNDFTMQDWERLEFRKGPAPCPTRDVILHVPWGN